MFLSAFVKDDAVTVHSSRCSHVVRDWRKYGQPVVANAESEMGLMRQLKALGIRVHSVRVMPCAGLPEGFWSQTPSGAQLKLLSTREGARQATKRIERQVAKEWQGVVNDMSPYLREAFGLTREN
jgi:hypothetical protein